MHRPSKEQQQRMVRHRLLRMGKSKRRRMELCYRGIHLIEEEKIQIIHKWPSFENVNVLLTRNDCTGCKWSGNNWGTVSEHIWFWFGTHAGDNHEYKGDLFIQNNIKEKVIHYFKKHIVSLCNKLNSSYSITLELTSFFGTHTEYFKF